MAPNSASLRMAKLEQEKHSQLRLLKVSIHIHLRIPLYTEFTYLSNRTYFCSERTAQEIFGHIAPEYSPQVALSILEIRGTSAHDLLSEPALQPVKISVASVGAAYQGLSLHNFTNKDELLSFIRRGQDLRFTRSTI